ncbi:MAG: hypothetical protein H7263_12135, partial [Candidatus Sericytochromatia bacterium]|nr:hypothetical protein [Candidatus Sericytochromatia bacterium]
EKTIDELLELSQEEFSKLFKNSPIKRSKLKGFLRNVIAMISSSKNPKYLPILEKLSIHDEEMVRNQALKAIDKIFIQ